MTTMYVRSGLKDFTGQPSHGYKVEFAHSQEDNCFVGHVPDLPGCTFHGANEHELAMNAGDAIREWIDEARRLGHPVPGEGGQIPHRTERAPEVTTSTFSVPLPPGAVDAKVMLSRSGNPPVTVPMTMEEGDKAAAAVAVAPRVTLADIEGLIVQEHHINAREAVVMSKATFNPIDAPRDELALLTLCILVLKNGYTIVGKSACAAPENFNAELGRKFAREDAIRQVWPLAGYELKTRLREGW